MEVVTRHNLPAPLYYYNNSKIPVVALTWDWGLYEDVLTMVTPVCIGM